VSRFAYLLAAFLTAASSALWSSATSAHGGSHELAGTGHAQPAAGPSHDSDSLAQTIAQSHCPADDHGLPCACGPDRCTNSPQPLPTLAPSAQDEPQAPTRGAPVLARNSSAIADRPPVGTVGSRAPPLPS